MANICIDLRQHVTYITHNSFHSVITSGLFFFSFFQWDLVCDKNYLSDLTQVIYQLGGMVGDIVGAPIADYFGRKWIHASCYIIVAAFGLGLGFSQNYTTFILIRFFIAIAISVSVISGDFFIVKVCLRRRHGNFTRSFLVWWNYSSLL